MVTLGITSQSTRHSQNQPFLFFDVGGVGGYYEDHSPNLLQLVGGSKLSSYVPSLALKSYWA